MSLIDRMGGVEAASGLLISAVEIFYDKLVSDQELQPFFEGVDINKLKKKQVEFLAYVFGGPEQYQGKGIYEAHEHLIKDKGTHSLMHHHSPSQCCSTACLPAFLPV